MSTISSRLIVGLMIVLTLAGCGIYSFTGADTSGAKDFSVGFFRSQTALASPAFSQEFTESLKDLILQQSNLKLVQRNGQLNFEGSITDYRIAPVGVQATETAAQNRLSVTVRVKYTNTLEPDKSFERNFTKFTDYDSAFDLLSLEAELNRLIIEQLTQEIFNASLGNW
jgi:hypothetical protein